jgi:hypothetical protein
MQRVFRFISIPLIVAALLLSLPAPAGARDREKEGDGQGRWLKIRVYEDGSKTPTVLVNLPMRLVSAAFRLAAVSGACADHVRVEGKVLKGHDRLKDVDLEALFKEIETLEAGQIIEIQDDEDRVSIWIE